MPNCKSTVCPKCRHHCRRCRKPVCETHFRRCPACNAALCSAHLEHSQRCYRKWIIRRTRLLVAAIDDENELPPETAESLHNTVAILEGARGIALAFLGESTETEKHIKDWYLPITLKPADQKQVLIELTMKLGTPQKFEIYSISEGQVPEAFTVNHDPLIAEYGLLPAPIDADEHSHLRADDWLVRCSEIIPGFDETRIRDAFRPDVLDVWSQSPIDHACRTDLRKKIGHLLMTLEPREEAVLRMLFGIGYSVGHSLPEVGKAFKVEVDRIKQIRRRAFRKLRRSHHSRALLDVLAN